MIYNWFDKLQKNFREKLELFLSEAKSKWFDIYAFETYRNQDRQYELYGYWRTVAELKTAWVPKSYAQPTKNKVTRTLKSNHLTGNAADIVFRVNWQPSWNWDYDSLIQIWKKFWLNNLKPKETCHFEDDWTVLKLNSNNMKDIAEILLVNLSKSYDKLPDTEVQAEIHKLAELLRSKYEIK